MPACSRPATSHRTGGTPAGPGTTGRADTSEAATVAGTTHPAGMPGHTPITAGHTSMAVGYTGIIGHGLATGLTGIVAHGLITGDAGTAGHGVTIGSAGIIGSIGITGHGRFITEAAGTAGPAGTTGPEVINGFAGIIGVREAVLGVPLGPSW
jgi:hypothetical protein